MFQYSKNASVFSSCPVLQHSLSVSVCKTLLFVPVSKIPHLKYPVYSDWSAHTRLSQHCLLCLQSALPFSFTSPVKIGINYASVWHGNIAISRSQGIKGGATDEVFQALQEQCFLLERGAPIVQIVGFITFMIFTCTKTYITHCRKFKFY